jgi:microcystin-dependent protein
LAAATRPRWLTPNNIPSDIICRSVFIPNDVDIISAVNGAIGELTNAENWEEFGSVTPEEIAERMLTLWVSYLEVRCMPTGAISLYAGEVAPAGFLFCDGAAHLIADYPVLATVLGVNWGSAPEGYFYVPDLRGKFVVGAGGSYTLADEGGSNAVTLTVGEMPAHSHTDNDYIPPVPITATPGPAPAEGPAVLTPGSTGSAGGGGAHENRPPYTALNYIICT